MRVKSAIQYAGLEPQRVLEGLDPKSIYTILMFSMCTTALWEMQISASANSICELCRFASPIFERVDNWQHARLQTITLMLFTCNANDW